MSDTVTRRSGPDRHAARDAGPSTHLVPGRRRRLPAMSGLPVGGLVITMLAVGFYYWIGAMVVHRIADDPTFGPSAVAEGESETLAMATALIQRETERHHWVANDPAFLPGRLLSRMAAFQQGIVGILADTVAAMADQTKQGDLDILDADSGRVLWDGLWSRRESDRVAAAVALHEDLRQAAELLASPGDAWILDFSTSFGRRPSAESQYQTARNLLNTANRRLAEGSAAMPDGADVVTAILDRFLATLDTILVAIDTRIANPDRRIAGLSPGAQYYRAKGQVYAMALILATLARDHPDRLGDPALADAWNAALAHLRAAASLRPLIVSNGALDALLVPNHWVGQGYVLHRATQALSDARTRLTLGHRDARP